MNWTETREALHKAGVEDLPFFWQWRIDLGGANLTGTDLRDAYLTGANLYGTDLRDAYLRGAYLTGADLRGADLRGAYLGGANLYGTDLTGASLNWNSHDLIAELLRQAAGESWQRRALAGLILVSRDWCWKDFLALEHPEQEWALGVLRQYVTDGDGAPDFLQEKDDGDELA